MKLIINKLVLFQVHIFVGFLSDHQSAWLWTLVSTILGLAPSFLPTPPFPFSTPSFHPSLLWSLPLLPWQHIFCFSFLLSQVYLFQMFGPFTWALRHSIVTYRPSPSPTPSASHIWPPHTLPSRPCPVGPRRFPCASPRAYGSFVHAQSALLTRPPEATSERLQTPSLCLNGNSPSQSLSLNEKTPSNSLSLNGKMASQSLSLND